MKTIQLKFKTLLFLLLIGFAFASCSSDDNSSPGQGGDNGNGNGNGNNNGNGNGTNGSDIVATIETDQDGKIDFEDNFDSLLPYLKAKNEGKWEFGLNAKDEGYRLVIIGIIDGEGEYTFDIEEENNDFLDFFISRASGTEIFNPAGDFGDGSIGEATLTITSLTEDHIKAEFSGVLYTDADKKATITNGKIDSDIDRDTTGD